MDEESFRRERRNEEVFTSVFDRAQWERLYRPDARTSGVAAVAVDVNPDRSRACIAAAAKVSEAVLVEIFREDKGVDWVVDEVASLVQTHNVKTVAVDGAGQARALFPRLEEAG